MIMALYLDDQIASQPTWRNPTAIRGRAARRSAKDKAVTCHFGLLQNSRAAGMVVYGMNLVRELPTFNT
jgi:hypothetical protein